MHRGSGVIRHGAQFVLFCCCCPCRCCGDFSTNKSIPVYIYIFILKTMSMLLLAKTRASTVIFVFLFSNFVEESQRNGNHRGIPETTVRRNVFFCYQ